jgi:FtsH-binding integral membrane protein
MLLLSLILLFIIERSYSIYRHPIDIAVIAAVIFILLFSPLTHLAGITPEQKDFSSDYPLYFVLVKVLIIYSAINILLRRGIFIKPLLILLFISMGIILFIP